MLYMPARRLSPPLLPLMIRFDDAIAAAFAMPPSIFFAADTMPAFRCRCQLSLIISMFSFDAFQRHIMLPLLLSPCRCHTPLLAAGR